MLIGTSEKKSHRATREETGGLPWIKFRLDLEPSPFSERVAEKLCLDLEILTGREVFLISVQRGCLEVNTRVSSTKDAVGRKLQTLFREDPEYHMFLERYRVTNYFFRAFSEKNRRAI